MSEQLFTFPFEDVLEAVEVIIEHAQTPSDPEERYRCIRPAVGNYLRFKADIWKHTPPQNVHDLTPGMQVVRYQELARFNGIAHLPQPDVQRSFSLLERVSLFDFTRIVMGSDLKMNPFDLRQNEVPRHSRLKDSHGRLRHNVYTDLKRGLRLAFDPKRFYLLSES
jgi:hypothetical protein